MKNIKNSKLLNNQIIWKNFDEVLGIPRPSGHSEKITDYIYNFAKRFGCETLKDSVGNVIARKKASSNEFANKDMICLQGHVDMVSQVAEGKVHDFTKDPIKAYVENGFLKAEGTTLGADNGIGISMMLSLIESNEIDHGPLEFLFTIDEENGIAGVDSLKEDVLKSKYLINLDSEIEGELFIGCAGNSFVYASFEYKKIDISCEFYTAYQLSVSGLKGGHSGLDIALGRANSIKILSRILHSLKTNGIDFYISEVKSGKFRNVIPSNAEAVLCVNKKDDRNFKNLLSNLSVDIKKEYKVSDPFITLKLKDAIFPKFALSKEVSNKIIDSLYCCHNGVYKMDEEFNVTQTSSNVAVLETNKDEIKVSISCRSLLNSAKLNMIDVVSTAFELVGATLLIDQGYCSWKPKSDSILVQVCKNVYRDIFEKLPIISVVHAGLECGVIGSKYPNMEMISIGPTIKDAHSINERVDITSVERVFQYLCAIIDNLK